MNKIPFGESVDIALLNHKMEWQSWDGMNDFKYHPNLDPTADAKAEIVTAHLEAVIEELERVLDNLHDSTLEPKLNDRIATLKAQLKGESDV